MIKDFISTIIGFILLPVLLPWFIFRGLLSSIYSEKDNERTREGIQEVIECGSFYYRSDQYDKALKKYYRALEYTKKLGMEPKIDFYLKKIGLNKIVAVLRAWADRTIDRDAINNRDDGGLTADCLIKIGETYRALGQYDKAIENHKQALAIFQKFDCESNTPSLLNDIGESYRALGRHDKAIESFCQALAIYQKDRFGVAVDHGLDDSLDDDIVSLGGYGWSERFETIENYRQVIAIDQKRREADIAIVLNNIGEACKALGQNDKAIENYRQSLAIDQKPRDVDIAIGLKSIGDVCKAWGQCDMAIENYRKALEVFQKFDMASEITVILNKVGEVRKYQKNKLMFASIKRGQKKNVEMLLNNGADVNAKGKYGRTALMYATTSKIERMYDSKSEIVRLLLDKGADVNVKDEWGKTALIFAAEDGYKEIVQLLLDKGADINVKDERGKTALIFASNNGRTETVRLLLDKGADVNAKGEYGETALMGASRFSRLEIVQLLLDKGADINAKNKFGGTALMYAYRIEDYILRVNVEKMLVNAGAGEKILVNPWGWLKNKIASRKH